jgi:hypothetical protein
MGISYFLNPPSLDTPMLSKTSLVVFAVAPTAAVMVHVIISTALKRIVVSVSTISFDAVV